MNQSACAIGPYKPWDSAGPCALSLEASWLQLVQWSTWGSKLPGIRNQASCSMLRTKADLHAGKKGMGGVCIKKTTKAMVIGIYDEGTQPGDVNMVVENLGDYLIGEGI